jgi:hypothetical protein
MLILQLPFDTRIAIHGILVLYVVKCLALLNICNLLRTEQCCGLNVIVLTEALTFLRVRAVPPCMRVV